ncbi:hypothetical protein ARMGADRAFT_157450 [Armillaria gallica]|uniref:Uncharacterized protein n=1 Tax=Armillaria gallica TaxID=47427 RepID=A0A2H3CBV0_ARMGA|nr:hypothetical protein ARMGADRAFT_157450 [Armillaria gallica]
MTTICLPSFDGQQLSWRECLAIVIPFIHFIIVTSSGSYLRFKCISVARNAFTAVLVILDGKYKQIINVFRFTRQVEYTG